MAIAKLTSKGQITIPKVVRDRLGLAPGDELEFVEEDGRYSLSRHIRRSVFAHYRGLLSDLEGQTADEIVKDLRGHET